jgi:hypothetical protein
LMPAMLMSGLRIQITWHPPGRAFANAIGFVSVHADPMDRLGVNGELPFHGSDDADRHIHDQYEDETISGALPDTKQLNPYPLYSSVLSWRAVPGLPSREPIPTSWKQNKLKTGALRDGILVPGRPNDDVNMGDEFPDSIGTPAVPSVFTIVNPEFSLCSVQLSDAVQRTLNEFSAVNGLEIVYTDYDKTTNPVSCSNNINLYTEVRKSASRGLSAHCRVVPVFNSTEASNTADQNASIVNHGIQRGLLDYQWQLGSLYFPQQKVSNENGHFGTEPVAYVHALECAGRFSGSKNCLLTLRGSDTSTHRTGALSLKNRYNNSASHPPTLESQGRPYVYGKPGSYCGGGNVISVSLERSSLFSLSGIPINNSRVLALRGHAHYDKTDFMDRVQIIVYLKYVKLARIFLNNVEVEQ